MLSSNRRLERLRKRFSMYRMHHKACLMMHQNYSADSECCFVKPQIRVNATANDPNTRPSSIVKRRHKKLPSGVVSNQSSSSLNRNKILGQPSQLSNQRRIPCEQMPTSNALSNILSNPSFMQQQTDDLNFVDSLESLLNFGHGVTVLPVLRDIDILDYFERIAK